MTRICAWPRCNNPLTGKQELWCSPACGNRGRVTRWRKKTNSECIACGYSHPAALVVVGDRAGGKKTLCLNCNAEEKYVAMQPRVRRSLPAH